MQTKIVPIQFFPDTADILRVNNVNVTALGDEGKAVVSWSLCNEITEIINMPGAPPLVTTNSLKTGFFFMSSDEYNAWGADDNYILNLTLNKLGLTPAQDTPVSQYASWRANLK